MRATKDAALHGVLTGDVVGSTELRSEERSVLAGVLREVYDQVRRNHPRALPYPIDVFSGDSWQIYLADPAVGLALAVYMRARLRERMDVEVRMVLAVDRVDFVQPNGVSESDGPAFRRSGRTIRELQKGELLRYLLPEAIEREDAPRIAADGISDVVDCVAQQWTQQQAQAIAHMLSRYPHEPTQQEIAAMWRPAPISQPAVYKHLRSAGWDWIARALDRYAALTRLVLEGHSAHQ